MQQKTDRTDHKTIYITAIALILLLSLYLVIIRFAEKQLYENSRKTVSQEVYLYGASFTNTLNQKLALIYGLTAHVLEDTSRKDDFDQDEFEVFSEYVFQNIEGIRNIAVAPDGVMKFVYPYEPNKNVIGYEPAADPRPEVRDEVRRAIESGQVTLSQPYELIQGGIGLIARQAVFLEGEYWGLTNLVIDLPALIQEAGITIPSEDLSIAFIDQSGKLFYGDEKVLRMDPVIFEVELPEGSWILASAPTGGWAEDYSRTLGLFQILSLFVVISLTLVVHQFSSRNVRLNQMVKQRTAELQSTEKKLREDIAIRERIKRQNESLLVLESQQRVLAETLTEVSLLFTSHTSISQLLNEILTQIHRLVPYETANIALLEGDKLVTKALLGYQDKELVEFLDGLVQDLNDLRYDLKAVETRVTQIVQDTEADSEWVDVEETAWIESYMVIPICYQDQVLGVIRLDGKYKGMFTESDAEKLAPLANSAAVALYNVYLYEQAQKEIVERIKAEAEIRKLNDELELRVEQRTAELKQINQELEAFAYSISHDLRAPVRAILGITQLMQEEQADVLSAEVQEYLNRITYSSLRMNDLIEGLLTLSHLGQQDLNIQVLDLNQITQQIFEAITAEETDRKFKLNIHLELKVCGDRQLLEALFFNLISNAVKFTRFCETAEIEIGQFQQEDRQVIFVRDNGIGFDMSYASKLFEPFYRLNTESSIEGTGIGLAIAKRVVQRHNGEIWVESKDSEGTTFYFYLAE